MGVNKTASSASSAMPISPEILHVLAIFLNVFTAPIREKAQTLIVGTLLARRRRAVTAALRQMGSGSDIDFSLYHQVLNRARWSSLQLSRLLILDASRDDPR
jgi:hypothetical protein